MEIRVLYFDGCPGWQLAVERLQAAVDELGLAAEAIEAVPVAPGTSAGFAGSPTILVDGRDLFSGPALSTGSTCRLYPTPQGPRGAPTFEAVVGALSERSRLEGSTGDGGRVVTADVT